MTEFGQGGSYEVSVAVCTYNRAASLSRTLESITRQEGIDGLDWELLVIDNNSSDDTRKVAESFNDRLPLRYIFEGMQGLSWARNRALLEFRGKALVFTDDDVRLGESWLAAYAGAMAKFMDCGFFGGQVKPGWNQGKPGWVRDESMALIGGLLVSYQLGDGNRVLEEREPLPFGASFGFRRELAEKVGEFRTDLGVVGDSLGRGEESDFMDRARAAGFNGAYVGAAVCLHDVDYERLRISYLYRYGRDKGISEARMLPDKLGSFFKEIAFAARGAGQLLKGRGDRFRQCVINMGIQRGLRLESKRTST